MRKIFIDLGAYNGDTIKQFFNWGHLLGDPKEFEIYAFEPNPEFKDQLIELADQKGNILIDPRAAWIKDGVIDFMPDQLGSTVMKSKKNWDDTKAIKVPCVDFSSWIKRFGLIADITVKMDIEGAEFPILEKMLNENTIDLVNGLWVEFHHNKVTDYTTTYKNELVERIKKRVLNFWEWH